MTIRTFELLAVDRLSAGSIEARKVATLDHELHA